MLDYNKKIYIAGHNGMVGSAILRQLRASGYCNIITKSRTDLDLMNQDAVKTFFDNERPQEVYLAAARVGGIHANNSFPAEFIYENLMIEANVIHHAWRSGALRLLFLGSSCIYPRLASNPMSENALLSGPLEPTNEPYAIAKIAGIKLCESYNRQYGVDYRSVMPTNLYGQNDNYHPENSHVIPSLIRRFCEAVDNNDKKVTIWGSGKPRREFLNVEDMADACIHIMDLDQDTYHNATLPMQGHINVGYGSDISILDLANMIARISGFEGQILCDRSKPDGPPRKLIDSKLLFDLGWQPSIPLETGLKQTIEEYRRSR